MAWSVAWSVALHAVAGHADSGSLQDQTLELSQLERRKIDVFGFRLFALMS